MSSPGKLLWVLKSCSLQIFQVKVDSDRYIKKLHIEKVESEAAYITARIERLFDTFCNGKPGEFSVSSKDLSKKITEAQLKSILSKYLLAIN